METILHDSKYATLTWNATLRYMQVRIKDTFIPGEKHKNMVLKLGDAIQSKHFEKIFLDFTNLKVLKQENQQLVRDQVLPSLIGQGVKAVAIAMPENVFGKFMVESITKHFRDSELKLKKAESAQEAKDWIETVEI